MPRSRYIEELGVTENQRDWCHAYIGPANFNASAAATMVGVDPSTGREYRSKQNVMAYLDRLQQEQLDAWAFSRHRVMHELITLGLSNISDVVQIEEGRLIVKDFAELPKAITAAIKKVKLRRVNRGDGDFDEVLELEMHDKLGALNKLADVMGMSNGGAGDPDELEKLVFTGLTIVTTDSQEESNHDTGTDERTE